MKIKTTVSSTTDIQRNLRKRWEIKPFSRVVTSKRVYSRKDKSWKTEGD